MTASVAARSTDAPRTTLPPGVRITALDGLRGFALLGMLAWHAELDWVRGGFARMTIFFALSGYLATRSWQRRRDEGFRAFWIRRTLRLLPMTLVGVALAIAVTLAFGSAQTRSDLGTDVVAVLTYTSNWHFIDSGQAYGELFERQSAFQHYWSLSIEEQLFLVLPVLLAGAAVLSRWARLAQWQVLAAGAVGVGALSVWVGPSPDALYFGTHTRLLEFLAGAALATSHARWSQAGPKARRNLWRLGRVSAVAIVVALAVVDRETSWLYSGGLHLFVVPVIAVFAAIETRDRWLNWLLGFRPLVWLGRAALSIYVLHWPLFVAIEDVVPSSAPEAAVAVVKVAAGVVVGGVAYRLVERPLLDDTRRLLRIGSPVARTRLVPMVGTGCLLAVVAVAVPTPVADYDFAEAAEAFEAGGQPDPPVPARTAGGSTVPRLGVFGGSTALMNGLGMIEWSRAEDGVDVASGDARLGCGLLEDGSRPERRDPGGDLVWVPVGEQCAGWAQDWKEAARHQAVEVAVVFLGVWDIADWRRPGSDEVTSIEDPAFRADLAHALEDGLDHLRAGGAGQVVLMTMPVVGGDVLEQVAHDRGLPRDHPDRTRRFNRLLRDVASTRSEVSVFDYAAVIEGLGTDLPRLVPDGVHPTWLGAEELWRGPAGRELLDHVAARH